MTFTGISVIFDHDWLVTYGWLPMSNKGVQH